MGNLGGSPVSKRPARKGAHCLYLVMSCLHAFMPCCFCRTAHATRDIGSSASLRGSGPPCALPQQVEYAFRPFETGASLATLVLGSALCAAEVFRAEVHLAFGTTDVKCFGARRSDAIVFSAHGLSVCTSACAHCTSAVPLLIAQAYITVAD